MKTIKQLSALFILSLVMGSGYAAETETLVGEKNQCGDRGCNYVENNKLYVWWEGHYEYMGPYYN